MTCAVAAGLVLGNLAGVAYAQPEIPPADAEEISFQNFTEPINLEALLTWVSKTLEINFILEDQGLSNVQVEFRAPMTIPRDDLLPMFDQLLGMYGYAVSQTDQGVYVVTQGAKLPVQFGGELPSTRIFSTPLIKPSALQTAINNALNQDQSASARMAAIDDLGVLISTAPGPVNRAIDTIIQKLVTSRDGWTFHRIDLTFMAASQAQQRLLELAGQVAPQAGTAAAAQAGAARVQAGALVNLGERLLLDHSANAIIFRGTAEESEQVKDLVDLIDSPSTLIVRRYTAGVMAAQITRMGERQGLGGTQQTSGGGASRQGGAMGSGFELGDTDSGFFTYYGTEEQHERVKELVEEFADQARLDAMVVEFYKLENANATEAAELLQELLELNTVDDFANSPFLPPSLEQSQRGIRRTQDIVDSSPPPSGEQAEGEQTLTPVEGIQILADEAANQLVVRAPVRQQEEIKSVIDRIDTRRPQVFIQAQIVTVNASESFALSVDTALTDPRGDFPTFTNFGLIDDPRNTTVNPLQGFTSAVIHNDYIPIIINALETEGDGRVLSTPRILVNDNEEASIDSTQNEPFSQTTQTVGTPTQTSLGGTISAGTRLSVTPQISSGGFLKLEFEVELSSFLEQTNPDLPPPTRSDVMSSVVTVPSGSTVVLGGLTFESENNSVNKVPILGDIPLLGELFKDQSERSSLRTLYVFLTPRILRDESFADLRLLTEGPLESAGLDFVVPPLEPVTIQLLGSAGMMPVAGESSGE